MKHRRVCVVDGVRHLVSQLSSNTSECVTCGPVARKQGTNNLSLGAPLATSNDQVKLLKNRILLTLKEIEAFNFSQETCKIKVYVVRESLSSFQDVCHHITKHFSEKRIHL